jgi:hypothetical protein
MTERVATYANAYVGGARGLSRSRLALRGFKHEGPEGNVARFTRGA